MAIPSRSARRLSEATGARVLVRAHHVAKSEQEDFPGVKDVSNYPHVEDLMAVADVLITDYSSIAYDFDLTGRMVVHFAPDRYSYVKERGMYPDWTYGRNVAESFSQLLLFVAAGLVEERKSLAGNMQRPEVGELSRIVRACALIP